jgi:LacI family transcriptional regulator
MSYLTGLGHRRIAHIGGRPDTLSARRRFEGYKDGLLAAGIPYDPELFLEGDYTRKRGQAAAHLLLDRPNRPTAIFAANDLSALGVMDVAQTMGIRVPQELSIIGFDDIPEATQVTPRLTTVDQSIEQMGAMATQVLIGWLKGEEPEYKLYKIPTRLIIRESCQAVSD